MVLSRLRRALLERVLRRALKLACGNDIAYDIVAAVRGPDIPLPYTKHIFTERIRHLVSCSAPISKSTQAISERDLWCSVLDVLYLALEEIVPHRARLRIADAVEHYLNHVHSALQALLCLGMIDPREFSMLLDLLWAHLAAIRGHTMTMLKRLWQVYRDYPDMIIPATNLPSVLEEWYGEREREV